MTHTSSQPSLPSGPQPTAGTACAGCQVGVPSPTSGGCSLTTRNSTTDCSCFSLICAITMSSSHSNSKTLELCSHLFSTSSWDPLLLCSSSITVICKAPRGAHPASSCLCRDTAKITQERTRGLVQEMNVPGRTERGVASVDIGGPKEMDREGERKECCYGLGDK